MLSRPIHSSIFLRSSIVLTIILNILIFLVLSNLLIQNNSRQLPVDVFIL